MTAVIGIPGFRFFASGFQTTQAVTSQFQRLKRLQDLPVGRPVLVPVIGSKQDGWTKSDQEVLGRVWLVRDSAEAAPDSAPVKAWSSVCPHMGCQIQGNASQPGFFCPCHRAAFNLTGVRQPDPATGGPSHSPRDMDVLPCRIVQDEKTGDAWIEVEYQKFETGSAQQVLKA